MTEVKIDKLEAYNSAFDLLADKILTDMKKGASTWEMPWHHGIPEAINQFSGRFYSGKNILLFLAVSAAFSRFCL